MPIMANHGKPTRFCDRCTHWMPEGFNFPRFLQHLQSSTYPIYPKHNSRMEDCNNCFKVPQHCWWSPAVNVLQALHASTNINKHQHPSTSINRIPCTQALLADSASALGRALPGHCIPLGVKVSFGKGLSWTAATRNTNLGKSPEQSLANASGKDCVRKHWHVRTWQNVAEQNIVWTQRRAFAVEASGNPGDGGNPAGDSAVTSAGRKWKKSEPAVAIYTCLSPTQEEKITKYNELKDRITPHVNFFQ